MPAWAKYLATVMALAGIGVCAYFLTRSVPLMIDWVTYLFDESRARPHLRGLATFVGVSSTVGTIVLVVGLALILWLLKQLWLPATADED